MDTVLAIFGAIAAVAGLGLLWWRSTVGKEIAAMAALATSGAREVAGLAPGSPVEVKGLLRVRTPLTAEFSRKPAAYFKAEIEREETYYERNSKGESQRRTRTSTVYTNMKYGSCLIEDQTGRVGIDFDGATVEAVETVNEPTSAPDVTGGVVSGILSAVSGASERYTRKESILAPDMPVYVLGEVHAGGLIGKPSAGSKNTQFVISHKSEEQRAKDLNSTSRWLLIGAAVLIVAALALFGWAIAKGGAKKAAMPTITRLV